MRYPYNPRLRYYCQKVLPTVYDDSLSYYELLDKLTYHLQNLTEDVNNLILDGLVPNFGGQWSADQTYAVGTIVYTEDGMATYISTQDVPRNVQLTNTDYWQVILDASGIQTTLEGELGEYKDQIDEAIEQFEQGIGEDMQEFEQGITEDFNDYKGTVDDEITAIQGTVDDAVDLVDEVKKNQYYVTPEMYGAKHNNLDDDGPAIEQALNSGYCVKLLSGEYNYLVKTPVTITTPCAKLCGPDLPWNSNVGNSAGITLTATGVIIANAEYFQATNVYFYAYDRSVGTTSAIIVNGPNNLDGDAEIRNCIFSTITDAIVANARGLIVTDCLFARCTPCITLNYVGLTSNLTPVTESSVTGGRRFIIERNTFHGGCNIALLIKASSSVSEFTFSNNDADVGYGEIRIYGTVYAGRIENNTWNLADRVIINSGGATIKNLIIANNLMRGKQGYAMPDRFIAFGGTGDVTGLSIVGNTFSDCGYSAIQFARDMTLTGVVINCNTFENIDVTGDNITYGAICLPDAFEGVVINGNIFGSLAPTDVGCAIRVFGMTEEGSLNMLVVEGNLKRYDKDYLVHTYLQTNATNSSIQTYRVDPEE